MVVSDSLYPIAILTPSEKRGQMKFLESKIVEVENGFDSQSVRLAYSSDCQNIKEDFVTTS